MYTYDMTVKLHDTDAAGVLFFANYFRLAHEAYENFMASIGFDFYSIIHEADYLPLIVHAEADFKKPLHVGNEVTIEVRATKIGRTSFELAYEMKVSPEETAATAGSVHVNIDKESGRPQALPEGLKQALQDIR